MPTIPTLDDWLESLRSLGAKPEHIRKIARALLGRAPWPTVEDERLPKRLRTALPEVRAFWTSLARMVSNHPGASGERLLLELSDAEIVAQAVLARASRPETKKVVFMGMGEPSHNLRNVLSGLSFLAEYGDFGHKNLVLSTVGDERLFDALFASDVRPALAVSLHTVDEEKRRKMLPRGCRMTVDALMERAALWARHSGYPVQYEWTLLAGVNDSLEEAEELARRMAGQYAMVNYIPVNAVEGSPWSRPDPKQVKAVVSLLRSRGIIATARDSAAQDVDGGCGQLRARALRIRKEKDVTDA